jgi:hypothetical protein
LRDALAENPAITFQAALHNLVLATFYRFAASGSCPEIGLLTLTLPAQAPGLKEGVSAKAIDTRHERWKERLPKNEADLWDALTAFDGTAQASLLAHCASFAANALYELVNRYDQGRAPPTAFALGLTKPMFWREPSGSTWSWQGGDRPSTTISAASPNRALSMPFGKRKASRPPTDRPSKEG